MVDAGLLNSGSVLRMLPNERQARRLRRRIREMEESFTYTGGGHLDTQTISKETKFESIRNRQTQSPVEESGTTGPWGVRKFLLQWSCPSLILSLTSQPPGLKKLRILSKTVNVADKLSNRLVEAIGLF